MQYSYINGLNAVFLTFAIVINCTKNYYENLSTKYCLLERCSTDEIILELKAFELFFTMLELSYTN
jgi:hypothetical protein